MKNKIILYNLNGKIENIMELNSINLGKINGMMTRCKMIDGTKVIGLADTFKGCENNPINTTVQDYIYLNTWDSLDETTHQLIDSNVGKYSQTHTLVYVKEIISVESILYSNPRWGGLLTNQFQLGVINMILETERLYLCEMRQSDFGSLCKILQDEDTMYAYEGAFRDDEVQEWLDRQIARYQKWGFGLWAVVLKENGETIGQCGLTMQPWKEDEVLEIGYLFERAYWHNGYATEAAKACKKYAFETLNAKEVCSIIRDTNIASQNVAIRNGMTRTDIWIKHYRGIDMPHYRYVVCR